MLLRATLVTRMLTPGRVIAGRHRVIRLLGSGGMGDVWHVRNEAVERDYAMKILSIATGDDAPIAKRLLREGRAAGRLRHPNIVEVFDAAIDPDVGPYVVMELLDGCSLHEALDRGRELPTQLTLSLGITIARALHVAHEAGVIHRDLKAANIFLHRAPDGSVVPKLVDFGISKVHAAVPDDVTLQGTILGSPFAMSPEQAAGRVDVDRRTDVWSLGALLYRLTTGRLPFRGATPSAMLKAVMVDDPIPVTQLAPNAPAELCEIIERCLRKEPAERPATAAEVGDKLAKLAQCYGEPDLRSLLDGKERHVEPSPTTELTPPMMPPTADMPAPEAPVEVTTVDVRSRRPAVLIAACAAAAIVIAVIALSRPRAVPAEPAAPIVAPIASVTAVPSTVATETVSAPATASAVPSAPTIVKRPKVVAPKPAAHEGVKHADF
jgi:eukaryotic-like serine/threonine-protein kinase